MSGSQIVHAAGTVLPLPLLPAAAALVAEYAAAGSRVVADDLAARFGRPVTGRHVGPVGTQHVTRAPAAVARLASAPPGRRGVPTGPPAARRGGRVVDQAPPRPPRAPQRGKS